MSLWNTIVTSCVYLLISGDGCVRATRAQAQTLITLITIKAYLSRYKLEQKKTLKNEGQKYK